MSDISIRVENVAKRYRLGERESYKALRDVLTDAVKAPMRRLRGGRAGAQAPDANEFWALRDVSFEVPQGEVVGIIGRNGSGKSTLLKILSRITEPTEGRIEMHGRIASLLEVGTGFHHELSGRDNIYLNGAILGMRKAEIDRKFDEIVAFSEVERFLDTPVKRYSSGMYVRLAFAVAAHLDPEILIVDEVLAVGDAAFQKKCLGKMGEVARGGRTVLYVSHNMAAVSQLCNSGIWLKQGRVEFTGSADEAVRMYMSENSDTQAEARWTPENAPGDDRVRLLGARVLQHGALSSIVDINEPASVELEFEVLQPATNLVTGVSLYTQEGACLICNCDWRPNQFAPGRYRKAARLPAQMLAEGRVNVLVQLIFFDPDIKSVVRPDTVSFDAIDSDHPVSVRGPYKGPWPGQLRVRLDWDGVIAA